jgi:hypothetical protein
MQWPPATALAAIPVACSVVEIDTDKVRHALPLVYL